MFVLQKSTFWYKWYSPLKFLQYFFCRSIQSVRASERNSVVGGSNPTQGFKKSIQAIFPDNELKITIQCNLKIVNYLDVTFNLTDSSYRPFNKTNNEIYITN